MALILSIDTSLSTAAICLSENGNVLGERTNRTQNEHASWIHQSIKDVLEEVDKHPRNLQAVAVTEGPGSYTGLRVGMATAKGLCFALKIPLILQNTLSLLAYAAIKDYEEVREQPALFCPMIDARRMEVFTAMYDVNLGEIARASALILTPDSFGKVLKDNVVVFTGNGMPKWQNICNHQHAVFRDPAPDIADLASLSFKKFEKNDFADLTFSEPFYLKNVYTG